VHLNVHNVKMSTGNTAFLGGLSLLEAFCLGDALRPRLARCCYGMKTGFVLWVYFSVVDFTFATLMIVIRRRYLVRSDGHT